MSELRGVRSRTTVRWWVPLAVLVVGLSLPYWFIPTAFLLSIATLTVLFAAAGVCWNLIGGLGGQISFGHSVFFGIGAYGTGLLYTKVGVTPWLGVVLAALLAAVAGLVTTFPALRLSGVYFTLTTFVLSLLCLDLAIHFRGLTGGDVGLGLTFVGSRPDQFLFDDPVAYYAVAVVLLGVLLLAFELIAKGRFGLFLRAVRDDVEAAEASGVDVVRVKLVGLTASAFGTGLAGGVYFQYTQFIDPASAFGLLPATLIALVALVGGTGRLLGPVVGAIILVPLQQYLSASLTAVPLGSSQLTYGLVVVLIVVLDRRGILPLFERVVRPLWRRAGPRASRAGQGSPESMTASEIS